MKPAACSSLIRSQAETGLIPADGTDGCEQGAELKMTSNSGVSGWVEELQAETACIGITSTFVQLVTNRQI